MKANRMIGESSYGEDGARDTRTLFQQAEEQPSAGYPLQQNRREFLGFIDIACIRLWLRYCQHDLSLHLQARVSGRNGGRLHS